MGWTIVFVPLHSTEKEEPKKKRFLMEPWLKLKALGFAATYNLYTTQDNVNVSKLTSRRNDICNRSCNLLKLREVICKKKITNLLDIKIF